MKKKQFMQNQQHFSKLNCIVCTNVDFHICLDCFVSCCCCCFFAFSNIRLVCVLISPLVNAFALACKNYLVAEQKNNKENNCKINNDKTKTANTFMQRVFLPPPLSLYLYLFLYVSFFSISVDYFSLHGKNNTYDDLPIREFLESNELTVLAAINHGDKLIFSHSITEDENCLVFYKIPQIGGSNTVARQSSTDDDTATVFPLGILTLEGGILKSIYNSISRVYSPYVAKVN